MIQRILPTAVFIFALGIYFGYVAPTWGGPITQQQATIAADVRALDSAKQYTAQQTQLANARDAINPKALTALTTFLPDSINNVGIILDLNALASRTGLSVSSINVAKESSNASSQQTSAGGLPTTAQNSPVGSVDLSLSAVGTFSAFQSFLQGVERSLRLLDVRSITIKGSDTGVYTYDMTIRLYWLR